MIFRIKTIKTIKKLIHLAWIGNDNYWAIVNVTRIYMKDVPEICSIISKLGFIFNSMYRFSSMRYWVVTILWVGWIIPVGILWKVPLQLCSWMCIWGDTLDLINDKMNVFRFYQNLSIKRRKYLDCIIMLYFLFTYHSFEYDICL